VNLTALDLVLVAVVVALCVGFLVWRLAFSGRKPACHPGGKPDGGAGGVEVGDALARGLKKARRKKSTPP
jgi:hypothetical protein